MSRVEFGILRFDGDENLRDLHPETRHRFRLLVKLAKARGLGELSVNSGARTYASQKRLYRAYVARKYGPPIVANPDVGYGSKHMVRPVTYKHGNLPNRIPCAYAVDIKWADGRFPSNQERETLRLLAREVGLDRSVPSEWWHFEPYKQMHVGSLLGIDYRGDDVSRLQSALNSTIGAGLVVDGDFGPATYKAVAAFQKATRLHVTGDWGHAEQQHLMAEMSKPKVSTPNVEGFDHNPTQYQTMREARARFRQIRAILTKQPVNAEAIAQARLLADEGAKLIHHEQND